MDQTELILRQIEEHVKLIRQQEEVIASAESSPFTKVQYKDLRRQTIKVIQGLAGDLYRFYIESGD